jgi:glutaredoxin
LSAWAEELDGISFPLMSDFWPHGEVAKEYGVFRSEGYSERAIFIIDKDGVIQYIDIHDIDDQPSNEVLFEELARIQPDVEPSQVLEEEEEEAPEEADIVMYCNRWCPDCRKARAWLAKHDIEYVEVDVTRHMDAAEKVRGWADGKLITPTFEIDGEVVVNWDEKKMREMLL